MNLDGALDLVLTSEKILSVLLGGGDGTFPARVERSVDFAVTAFPSLVVGDLNGDEVPDVALKNPGTGSVSVLLGAGDGALQDAIEYEAAEFPSDLALGDLNNDGFLDLVVTGSSGLSTLLGNGDGTFVAIASTSSQGNITGFDATLGDFTGDGQLDLGVADSVDRGTTSSLFPGNGDGTFGPSEYFASDPTALAAADLNSDGKLDLICSSYGAVNVLLQTDSTLMSAGVYPLAGDLLAVGDVNNDGQPDVATADNIEDRVRVLLGDGLGALGTLGSADGVGR